MEHATTPGNIFEELGNVRYYHNLVQGCDEWLDLRKGMLTASTMKLALSEKTLKIANNDKISLDFLLVVHQMGLWVNPV